MPQKYLKVYEEHNDYTLDSREYIPNVSHCREEDEVHYRNDLSREYLTFKILSDGYICIKASNANYTVTLEYSKNNDPNWTSITSSTEGVNISVVRGDRVQFRGDNYAMSMDTKYNSFSDTTANFSLRGNVVSLVTTNKEDWGWHSEYYCFYNLFKNCTTLLSAKELCLPYEDYAVMPYQYKGMFQGCTSLIEACELPVKLLGECYNCYEDMFSGCTSLTIAPEILATGTDSECYKNMFANCTALTKAPTILPSTYVTSEAYSGMFQNCTSLTKAPILPAVNVFGSGAYKNMFKGCTNLNYIECLMTTHEYSNVTEGWVDGVAATGTFIKNNETTEWTTGINGIPTGWITNTKYIKLDYYEFAPNEYLDLGKINSGKMSYPDGSGSPCWGGVQVHFDSSITLNDIDNKTIVTNNSHKFSLQSRCTVDGSLITGGQNTSSSWPNQYIYLYILEASKSSGNYNNAVWWYNGSPGKYYFSTYGSQPWDFVNSKLIIGSTDGTTCTSKITTVLYMVPTTGSLEWRDLYPYRNVFTNEIIFQGENGLFSYPIKTI